MWSASRVNLLLAVTLMYSVMNANSQTLCPDGSYVGGASCRMAPDGSYVGGDPQPELQHAGTHADRFSR